MREHYRSIPVPKSSPWGPVQGGEEIAPGIVSVWSAGHGGIGISDERASDMLSSLRCIGQESTFHKGYDRGFVWFEEDCEWAAVAVSFPEHFTASLDAAWATLRRYYPGIAPSGAADIGVEALVAEMSSRGCSGEEIDDAVEAHCNETDPAPLCPVCLQGMEQRWDRSWACIEADRSICTR